jgi:hypothetical protein
MGRRFPNRRRRRPGRRPPNRFSGRHGPAQAPGFTPAGVRTFYNVFMPGLQGREKREYFNQIAAWMIIVFGLGGAMMGYAWFGVLGVVIGLGAGIAAGGAIAEKGRFFRRCSPR